MLLYKLVERKNPQSPQSGAKFHAKLIWTGNLTTTDLAKRISSTCTVTYHDCVAVLSALQEQIIYALKDSKSVSLDKLGTFSISFKGDGSDTEKEYKTNMLRQIKINFRACSDIKNEMGLKNVDIAFNRMTDEETADQTEVTPEP